MTNSTTYTAIIDVGWLLFILVWLIAAVFTKRAARGIAWRKEVAVRLVAFLVIVAVARASRTHPLLRRLLLTARHATTPVLGSTGVAVGGIVVAIHILGLVVFLAGMLLAFWARYTLGRNWGAPMTLRQDHELVVDGPYRVVRHPIYSGFLLAALGSILAGQLWWLLIFPVVLAYFLYGAVSEEKTMTEQFPTEYPEYKKHTKMLIPFLL